MTPVRQRAFITGLVLTTLFLALRLLLFSTREPFFDELFSVWMARQPLMSILAHLRADSGPPLYYFLARIPSVDALRLLSLAAAAVPLAILLREKRWLAALLLAVHPAAAIFAVTARPYAICAAMLAIGMLLLERERPFAAAAAFVAAAYTHYLAVLFFPTLLFGRGPLRRRVVACLGAGVAFVPGFLLSRMQPPESIAWMDRPRPGSILMTLGFTGDDVALTTTAIIAGLLTIVAVLGAWRRAPFVLVPLACVLALSLVAPALFPSRFASLLAFPLVWWMSEALQEKPRALRWLLAGGVIAIAILEISRAMNPPVAYRHAAELLRANAPAGEPVIASGYLYLEAVHQLGASRVRAFPAEQAVHPGWRVPPSRGAQASPAELPRGTFLWIGERNAPELRALRGRRARLLHQDDEALILRVH